MPSLHDTYLKLERAQEHLSALNKELSDFLGSKPYTVSREYDAQERLHTFQIHINSGIPERLGLMAGDAVHNMRSALDALVYQLTLFQTDEPGTEVEFPIFKTGSETAIKTIQRSIELLPQQAQNIIYRYQPYKLGYWAETHCLWVLRCFDVADKHKVVPAVHYGIKLGGGQVSTLLPPTFMGTSLQQGKIVFALKSASTLESQLNPNVSLQAGFKVPGLIDYVYPLMLQVICHFVRDDLVAQFREFFPKD